MLIRCILQEVGGWQPPGISSQKTWVTLHGHVMRQLDNNTEKDLITGTTEDQDAEEDLPELGSAISWTDR